MIIHNNQSKNILILMQKLIIITMNLVLLIIKAIFKFPMILLSKVVFLHMNKLEKNILRLFAILLMELLY